jgi:periplasmic/secreted protein
VFALLYCIAAEYFPKIKLWQGAAFGLLVWIGARGGDDVRGWQGGVVAKE